MSHFRLAIPLLSSCLLAGLTFSSTATAALDDIYLGLAAGSSESDSRISGDPVLLPGIRGISPLDPMPAPTVFPLGNVEVGSGGTSWSVLAGLPLHEYVDAEVGYTRLGSFDSPMVPNLELEPEEWSLSLKGHFPLGERFSALWLAGLSRASFETNGSMRYVTGATPVSAAPGGLIGIYTGSYGTFVPVGPGITIAFPGTVFTDTIVPVQQLDDERGYLWGFGFSWTGSERLQLELRFTRHELQVMSVDKLSAGLLLRL